MHANPTNLNLFGNINKISKLANKSHSPSPSKKPTPTKPTVKKPRKDFDRKTPHSSPINRASTSLAYVPFLGLPLNVNPNSGLLLGLGPINLVDEAQKTVTVRMYNICKNGPTANVNQNVPPLAPGPFQKPELHKVHQILGVMVVKCPPLQTILVLTVAIS
ncbi:hypothetical protein L1887_20112 [Cichorium endivia]|nr:hypothetical protein L1887_20112 [Cichorium endivia]